jgi:hypothetical protein
MSFDYARMHATALRLIDKFGQVGMLRKLALGASPVDAPITIAVLDYKAFDIDGTRVLAGDRLIYVAPQGVDAIKPGNVILDAAAKPYQVVDVKIISPAGIVVYYEVQGRGPR